MKILEYYNPRLIISEHFDYIITKLDIHTEYLLKENINDSTGLETICKQREMIINQLKLTKDFNLRIFNESNNNEKDFEEKWKNLIENLSLSYEEKMDILKIDLIKEDCVLMVDLNCNIKYSLWLIGGFNSTNDLSLLRLKFFFNHFFFKKNQFFLKKFSNFDSCGNVLNLKKVHHTNSFLANTNKNTQNIYKLGLLDKVNFALFF